MKDQQKTKEQLINELGELRQRITELEESKTEWMKNTEELMERSLDSIMFTETVGYVTKVNKHFLEMLGYSEEEVVGKFVAELTPTNEGETYESVTGELVTIDKDFLDNTQQLIEELLTTGKVVNWEAYYLRKDNKVVPIEQNIVCLYDQKGERKGAVSIIRDITERKITENDSRKTRESLDNLLESSLDGIIVSDNVGNVTRVNKAFLQLIQFDEEDVIGKHVMELSVMTEGTYDSTTGELVDISEDFFNTSMEMTAKLYEEGKVSNWESYYLRKDKKIVPVEMQIAHLFNEKNDTIGSVGITRDITDRRRVEKELAQYREGLEDLVKERTAELSETKDYLDNIIENSLDGIIIGDSTGNIVRVNDSLLKLLGYQREEIIGRHVMELSPSEEREYISTTGKRVTIGERDFEEARKIIYEKLFEEGKISNWNNYYLRKDGRIVFIEQNIFYLYNKEGNIIGSVGINRDITVRKQQEEELKKAYDEMEKRVEERTSQLVQAKEEADASNKAKSDFLANMSHELRTPLNHIIGFTEMVIDKRCGELSESQEEYLSDVLKSSRHLLSLINDILDLSKVEAGKFELEPTEVDPKLFLNNCLIMFKEKAMKHGIELASHIDHIPETMTVDERKMKQIVYNILSNAMKFTPDGGRVLLSAKMVDCIVRPGLRSGDPKGLEIISGGNGKKKSNGGKERQCLQLSVADSGIGIDPEDQSRIFDPFEQADGSSSRRYQGTGLGLPLTKKLVQLHGGRMWVESEGEGKGSTFSFLIPV